MLKLKLMAKKNVADNDESSRKRKIEQDDTESIVTVKQKVGLEKTQIISKASSVNDITFASDQSSTAVVSVDGSSVGDDDSPEDVSVIVPKDKEEDEEPYDEFDYGKVVGESDIMNLNFMSNQQIMNLKKK